MYEMKDEYKTGIELIDKEHEKLFNIAEEAYQLLKNDYSVDKYDKIVAIIDELKDYTKTHFKHEEEYMESINYKKYFTQKLQHSNFIGRLDELDLREVDEHQNQEILDLLEFLNQWLVNHIIKQDKLIGA